jgi:tetratricopeptide (TPR) repeat protein
MEAGPAYDVALSFANEDRDHAEALATELTRRGVSAFYDRHEKASIWGNDAYQYLTELYRHRARFFVFFASRHYAEKLWTNQELKAAQARALVERGGYILPIRLDATEIPGLLPTTGYLSLPPETPVTIADAIESKLGRPAPQGSSQGPARVVALRHQELRAAKPHQLQSWFTGRASERRALSQWFGQRVRKVCLLKGLGGMGKSSLAWVWINEDVLRGRVTDFDDQGEPVPDVGAALTPIWFSFYGDGATFSDFLVFVLEAFGRDPKSEASPLDATIAVLRDNPALLIMDGFERVEESGENWRPVSQFLSEICAPDMKSRVLITSRDMPRELTRLAAVQVIPLEGLQIEEALLFLQRQGVVGELSEMSKVVATSLGYPLGLRLIAGALVDDPEMRGDIRGARSIKLQDFVDEKDVDRNARQLTQLVWFACSRLPQATRDFLGVVACIGGPATIEAITAQVDLPRDAVKKNVALLEKRGLLLCDAEKATFFLHPSVAGFVEDDFRHRERTYEHLHAYFARKPRPLSDQIRMRSDLTYDEARFRYAVGARRYEDAMRILRDELFSFLFYRFCDYGACAALLDSFFPARKGIVGRTAKTPWRFSRMFSDGRERPYRLSSKGHRIWVLNAQANCQMRLGESERARTLLETAVMDAERGGLLVDLMTSLANLAEVEIRTGRFAQAGKHLERELSLHSGHGLTKARAHMEKGRLLGYCGDLPAAERELEIAASLYRRKDALFVVALYQSRCALLNRAPAKALAAAQQAYAWWQELGDLIGEEKIILVHLAMGAALEAVARESAAERESHLRKAIGFLDEARVRCTRIAVREVEADVRLTIARVRQLLGDRAEATRQAKAALAIATPSDYRLTMADVANLLADLALEEKDVLTAESRTHSARQSAGGASGMAYRRAVEDADRRTEKIAALAREK